MRRGCGCSGLIIHRRRCRGRYVIFSLAGCGWGKWEEGVVGGVERMRAFDHDRPAIHFSRVAQPGSDM